MAEAQDATDEDFKPTPQGEASRWAMEFTAARKELKDWHKQGDKIVKRYKDEREGGEETRKLNLFSANINTLGALLYGKTPQVDVTRRFADAQDDVARVAAEMLERLLNTDVQEGKDGYAKALKLCLSDRLLPGGGQARMRYEVEFGEAEEVPPKLDEATGEELAPGYTGEPPREKEEVETDYVYWKDQLWSPSRFFSEVRWWAFKAEMTKRALKKRFGADMAKDIPLNSKRRDDNSQQASPWAAADVWEVWDKENKKVFWLVEGMDKVLEEKEDPLELEGFWPFAEPMFANLTTSAFVPLPDFKLAQDLYNEVDEYTERIRLIQSALRVAGAYDQTAEGLQRLLDTKEGNILVPVATWAMFAEKGGIAGAISWLPLDQVVAALDKLRELRTESIGLLYQVTGMSDIMRGQASASTTATEQAIKAKFASVRVQSLQDEFARFASDLQTIKAEIICKHFDADTIIQRSNVLNTADKDLAQQAVQLLKSNFREYRVQVKPEAVSLTDYAQVKSERSEFLQAVAGFLAAAGPIAQAVPGSLTMLLQMLQWATAGFRGASTIEGVLDAAVRQAQQQQQAAAQQPPQPPPPDPKLQAQQMKGQQELQKGQQDFQHGLQHMQAEVQADNQKQAQKAKWAVLQSAAQERQKVVQGIDAVTHPPGVE